MKKIKYIAYFILTSITITSCSDEFLDKENTNALKVEDFWRNNEDLNHGLTGAYKAFSSPHNIRLVESLQRSDFAWGSGFRRPATVNPFYLQIFNNSEPAIDEKWAQNYKTIFAANQVIIQGGRILEGLEDDDEKKTAIELIAQARFIRGYMYFLLHNEFNKGSVPIKDYLPNEKKEEDFITSVSSSKEVREFYLKDLEFAKNNLPVSWKSQDLGRVTTGAAVALIAQSHLYAGEFKEASDLFESVINDYDYELMEDPSSNITTKDEFNQESILEVAYSLESKKELGEWDARDVANSLYVKQFAGVSGWFGVGVPSWLIMKYKEDTPDPSDGRNKGKIVSLNPTVKGLSKYSPRTSYSLALVDDLNTPYYGHDNPGQVAKFNIKFTAYYRKHTNWDLGLASEDLVSPGKVRSGVNERLIRLGEIYLQYAECQIELGNLDVALTYINKIRKRAGVVLLGSPAGTTIGGEFSGRTYDEKSYDLASLMEHLRYTELALELSAEGDGNRNVDLRRWGKYGNYVRNNNKLERLKELSNLKYRAKLYEPYKKLDPITNLFEKRKLWESELFRVNEGDGTTANEDFNDNVVAARNYNEELHDYYPIPNREIISNPSLNN